MKLNILTCVKINELEVTLQLFQIDYFIILNEIYYIKLVVD